LRDALLPLLVSGKVRVAGASIDQRIRNGQNRTESPKVAIG
jgi:hypothetical protein